eukprot:s6_g31.t1
MEGLLAVDFLHTWLQKNLVERTNEVSLQIFKSALHMAEFTLPPSSVEALWYSADKAQMVGSKSMERASLRQVKDLEDRLVMYLSGGMFYESLRGLIVNELHVPSLHSLDAKEIAAAFKQVDEKTGCCGVIDPHEVSELLLLLSQEGMDLTVVQQSFDQLRVHLDPEAVQDAFMMVDTNCDDKFLCRKWGLEQALPGRELSASSVEEFLSLIDRMVDTMIPDAIFEYMGLQRHQIFWGVILKDYVPLRFRLPERFPRGRGRESRVSWLLLDSSSLGRPGVAGVTQRQQSRIHGEAGEYRQGLDDSWVIWSEQLYRITSVSRSQLEARRRSVALNAGARMARKGAGGNVTLGGGTTTKNEEEEEEEPEPGDVKGFFYEVNVDRQGLTGLGLQLEASDPRYCFVAAVKADGLIEMWNKQCKGDVPQVTACDRLVKVNGVAFPSQILVTKACGFGALSLTFQRPRVFQVTVRKKTCWGLDIAAGEHGLTIMAIQDGAIQEWNDENPEREVHVGDRIVAAAARRSSVNLGDSAPASAPRCTAVFTGDGSSVSDCLLETLQSRSLQGPVCMTIMSWSCGDDFDETSGRKTETCRGAQEKNVSCGHERLLRLPSNEGDTLRRNAGSVAIAMGTCCSGGHGTGVSYEEFIYAMGSTAGDAALSGVVAGLTKLAEDHPYLKPTGDEFAPHPLLYWVRRCREFALAKKTQEAEGCLERVLNSLEYELAQIRDAFRRFDHDDSKQLDTQEFKLMCAYIGWGTEEAMVMDLDHDQKVSLEEFERFVGHMGGLQQVFQQRRQRVARKQWGVEAPSIIEVGARVQSYHYMEDGEKSKGLREAQVLELNVMPSNGATLQGWWDGCG